MASSSSCTPSSQSQKEYEVFISFRGEDTRLNFTSHLHEALRRNYIETYIDYRLEKGDEVWPALEKAIEDSTLFLVIFSENYASSTWCLKELTKILECSKTQGLPVMPVFYRVNPSHVRKQSGNYQKAFEELKRKSINEQQLQEWRGALKHAANLSGWHCRSDSNEAELISKILECVIKKLNWVYRSEEHVKDLIGIDKRMAAFESLLSPHSNDVRFIGIWGMGGVGKTTLAKALFNRMCFAYEGGFCFFTNVREESKKYGIDGLRKNLVSGLLGDKESNIAMGDATFHFAMRRLSRKKNLIVFDDVDDHEHLKKLAGSTDWFGPGSRILITARDKQILVSNKVDHIYQLEVLNPDEAFQLFSLNAFKEDYGDPKMTALAKKVTQYADGNPLALKVLGSLLCGKNQEAWESQLEKLQKLPCPKINDILKLSFEGLDEEEKNIFLHIVCFFNGYNVKDVKKWLAECGYSTIIGLEGLEDKALLNTCEGKICVHHLIKEMGRQIIREKSYPKMRVRIWNSYEIFEILKENAGSEAIEGIIVEASKVVEDMCLSPQVFRSFPSLRFLIFYQDFNESKVKFPGGIELLPNKLILLCWKGCPLKSLPATFNGENLAEIKMPFNKLTKLWDGVQNLVNLTKIDLGGSKDLIELPDFSKAIHLKKVNLYGCSKLKCVHPSILSLHSLCGLQLSDCEALTSLTSNTHLKSLSELELSGCSKLNKFSVTSENCKFTLDLSRTAINGELYSSSGSLSKIEGLCLQSCRSVTSLHKLVDLCNLRELNASYCNKLALNLRPIFDEMHALEVLELRNCSELFEVPDNISLLSSLRELDLGRSNIETLPLSIKHLLSLQKLYLYGCERLRSVPGLPSSISELWAQNCQSLVSLHLPLTNEGEEGKHSLHLPLTNRGEEGEDERYVDFRFTNCIKLDEQSIKALEAKVLHEMNKAIYDKVEMEYPGERVPEWFTYRTTESPITVDLRSIPQPWDGSFVFCAVICKPPSALMACAQIICFFGINAKWLIDGQYVCESTRWLSVDGMYSDHIFLWYYGCSCGELQRGIEEKKRQAQSDTYHPLLQIQFTLVNPSQLDYGIQVKECGVCPTSAVEYQSDIKQIKLPLHSTYPNSVSKETVSRKRKYHSLLR